MSYDTNLLDLLVNEYNQPQTQAGATEALATCITPSSTLLASSAAGPTIASASQQYVDLSSQTVNCLIGQNHPWVGHKLAAFILSDQPSFLSSRYHNAITAKTATRLISLLDFPSKKIVNFRQCNGSDVTELAVKSAANASDKTTLLSFEGSYHGQNLTNYKSSHVQTDHDFWEGEHFVKFVSSPPDRNDPDAERRTESVLSEVAGLLDSCFAVIIEPIQANNNFITPPKEFFTKLDALCKRHKVPLIIDEIQTGFGWLGDTTASHLYGIDPEFIALSKALTSGYGPLAALISSADYDNLAYGTGEKTNGGDLRSLVACNATIDVLYGITNEGIRTLPSEHDQLGLSSGGLVADNFQQLDTVLAEAMERIASKHSWLLSRGFGLMRALVVELPAGAEESNSLTKQIAEDCFNEGVMVRPSQSSLVIKPAIVTTKKQLENALKVVERVIDNVKI